MMNAFYLALLLLASNQMASALPEQNFSGTWILNQINAQAIPSHPISIAQKGNKIVIEDDRLSIWRQEYVADGTKRKSTEIGLPTSTYYTAKFEGNSLIIDKESNYTSPDGRLTIPFRTRDVWSISVDGKTLTHLMPIGVKQQAALMVAYQRVGNQ